jgi:hypothetical protein
MIASAPSSTVLEAAVPVEVGGGVTGVDGVDLEAGQSLGVLAGRARQRTRTEIEW